MHTKMLISTPEPDKVTDQMLREIYQEAERITGLTFCAVAVTSENV